VKELNQLYSDALAEFAKIMKPGGKVAMIWPVFQGHTPKPQHYLDPCTDGFKIIKPLPDQYLSKFKQNISPRGNLLYGRPGQRVHREIMILQK
jgi:hypothetical protein